MANEVVLQSDYSRVTLRMSEWRVTVAPKAVPSFYHRSDWINADALALDASVPARARVAPSPPLAAGRTTGPRLGAASEADHGDGGR